jgi:enediyne biosynthesis protein E3
VSLAVLRGLRTQLLGISPAETSFAVRGFHGTTPEKRRLLEQHGAAFVTGFNLALAARDGDELADRALAVPAAERGFAYEGAGMALALLDLLALGRGRRLAAFLGGRGAPHVYMVHVGAGWALARLRRRPWGPLRGLDPLLRWLATDGYGFHHGFFSPGRFVRGGARPRRLTGYQLRVFDQGLGRSLWFVDGADVERIAATVSSFPAARKADLWSGVGLAAAYAGAVQEDELERLAQLLGPFRPHAAQGAAFAATARLRAGNPVPHTTMACEVLGGRGVEEAAAEVEAAFPHIEPAPDGIGYELWRTRIRRALVGPQEVAV